MKTRKYYHVTEFENVHSILKNGISANQDGEIFLFDTNYFIHPLYGAMPVSDYIAHTQLFIKKPIVFEIKAKGILNELSCDNVAEYTAKFQWILKQDKIDKKYITPIHIDPIHDAPNYKVTRLYN
jgi:hypothetical protein